MWLNGVHGYDLMSEWMWLNRVWMRLNGVYGVYGYELMECMGLIAWDEWKR